MDTRSRAAANDAAISDAVERARSSVFTDDAVEGLAADDFEPVMNARAARWQTHHASTSITESLLTCAYTHCSI